MPGWYRALVHAMGWLAEANKEYQMSVVPELGAWLFVAKPDICGTWG